MNVFSILRDKHSLRNQKKVRAKSSYHSNLLLGVGGESNSQTYIEGDSFLGNSCCLGVPPLSYDAAAIVIPAVLVFDTLAVVALAVPEDVALNFGGTSAEAGVVQSHLN